MAKQSISGWARPDDARRGQRHFYWLIDDQAATDSLCGRGVVAGRRSLLLLRDQEHGRADNCKNCNRRREVLGSIVNHG